MHYDIAGKVIMERAGIPMLRTFAGLKAQDIQLIEELPQESVSLKRSAYILKITDNQDRLSIVVVEFLTSWKEKFSSIYYRTL